MEQDKTSAVSGAAGSEPNVREYAEAMKSTDLEVESSYVEDGKELNVLVSMKVSPDEKPGDPEPRWTIITDSETREVIRSAWISVWQPTRGLTTLNTHQQPNRWSCSNDLQRSANEEADSRVLKTAEYGKTLRSS